jgi:nicotine blue oxidoreductase
VTPSASGAGAGTGRDAAVAGLLLAAGSGTRLGRPKALVQWQGRLLVEHGVALLRQAGLDPCVVVLGAAADDIRRHADLGATEVVVNARWAEGMGGSLRAGLGALDGRAPAVVITLVDQPLVGTQAVARLIAAWEAGAQAAVATYQGQPANPVLLDASLWADVATDATGDSGARRYLRRHPELVTPVPCDGTGSAADIDTPQDLAEVSRAAGP